VVPLLEWLHTRTGARPERQIVVLIPELRGGAGIDARSITAPCG
jgi:hypothetical protein